MDRFWDLLEQNILVSSGIAVLLVGGTVYCVVAGIEIPDVLMSMTTLVLGYFFGAKSQGKINHRKVG